MLATIEAALVDLGLPDAGLLNLGLIAGLLLLSVGLGGGRRGAPATPAWAGGGRERGWQNVDRAVRPPASASADPLDQLRKVSEAAFAKRPLLNRGETAVFNAAEAAVKELGLDWRVMAQVCLGEVLSSPDPEAHRCINAKRVDMLVVDGRSEPLAAIEYQGGGHWRSGTAPARDAVKKEALRRAGVRWVEVTPEHGPADVRRELKRIATVEGLLRPIPSAQPSEQRGEQGEAQRQGRAQA